MLEEYVDECFERNEWFDKMMELFKIKEEGEKHHIIPKAFFKKKKLKIIDENNLITLSRKNHILAHYYIFKCAKEIIRKEMSVALSLMLREVSLDMNITEEEIKNIKFVSSKTRQKKVVCLDTAIVYNSRKEAAKLTGVDEGKITLICNHKSYSSHNLHFEWATKPSYTLEECKQLIRTYKQPTIRVKCLETGIVYNSISEASKITKIPRSKITAVCSGKQKSAHNTHWEYIDTPTTNSSPKKVICLETKEVFNSLAECCKKHNLDLRRLQRVIGFNKTINGKHYDLYNPNKNYTELNIQQLNKKTKRIICLELLKVFNSIKEAKEYFQQFGIKTDKISDCLRGVRKTTGNLHFEYFNTEVDYSAYAQKRIEEIGGRNDFVKCLETGKVYSSKRQAEKAEKVFRVQIEKSLKTSSTFAGKTWVYSNFEEWKNQVINPFITSPSST